MNRSRRRVPARVRSRRLLGVLVAGAALLSGALAAGSPSSAAVPDTHVPAPTAAAPASEPATSAAVYLFGQSSVSSTDAWAVGYSSDSAWNPQALAEHWNGKAWSIVAAPAPTGAIESSLASVDAVSSTDVWAAGWYSDGVVQETLIDHWNGKKWSVVPSPTGGSDLSFFLSVHAVSADDVWAVGASDTPQSLFGLTFAAHWDGTSWTVIDTPNPDETITSWLNGVSGTSADDVWAVGDAEVGDQNVYQTVAEHWDGTSWTLVRSPNPKESTRASLMSVDAVSSDNVWAVGCSSKQQFFECDGPGLKQRGLIEHWNGSKWSIVANPAVPKAKHTELTSIAGTSADDIWAVGSFKRGGSHTLIEHFDGTSWSAVASPDPKGDTPEFESTGASSSSNAWAVGEYLKGSAAETLTEHWNGKAWTVVASPTP